jgi:hypothetical protein
MWLRSPHKSVLVASRLLGTCIGSDPGICRYAEGAEKVITSDDVPELSNETGGHLAYWDLEPVERPDL